MKLTYSVTTLSPAIMTHYHAGGLTFVGFVGFISFVGIAKKCSRIRIHFSSNHLATVPMIIHLVLNFGHIDRMSDIKFG